MTLDVLPDTFVLPTRAQGVSDYKRNYVIRNPDADVSPGSLVDIDANVITDTLAPIYYDASLAGNAAALDNMTTAQLQAELVNLGTNFLPATGASGEVYVSCSAGGTYIPLGQQINNLATGVRYQCSAPGLYQNGQALPVQGIDTGPSTNILATTPPTVLTWVSPPIGCNPTAAVVPQTDGTGLSGGSAAETNAQAVARIRLLRSSPPASGNDAEYQADVADTASVPVQAAFTYPSIQGPGTTAVCFTLKPISPGANRIPNATQILQAQQQLTGQIPASDVPLFCTLVSSPLTVVLKVTWAQGATGWVDASPWPLYASPIATAGATVQAPTTGTASATYFRLDNAAHTLTQPQVGQSIAMYDNTQQTFAFRRKKILSSVADGAGGWDITVDTTTSASDTSYTPTLGQAVCPWSDSLSSLIAPTVAYFDTLGPGEQKSTFFDPGLRQKRSPANPQAWPSTISNRLLGVNSQTAVQAAQGNLPPITLFTLTTLQDVILQEPTVPYVTPVGSPGVSSYLITLANLVAFPE